jgi:hypothetical protein
MGKTTLTLGGQLIVGPYSKIKGSGKTASGSVIQFNRGLSLSTDAVVMQWAAPDNLMTTAEIDDVFINPQGNGQDALRVIGGRNWKVNVEIENAGRDCLVIGGDQAYRWTEQATVDAEIFNCGRHGMRLDTSAGTFNFITHLTFPHIHIGGVIGGNPIYVAMNSGVRTGSSGVMEVAFNDLHIMTAITTATDAIYFACAGGANNFATYWNFYNGEIENGVKNSGYILNGQAGCLGGTIFHNMWLDTRWGAGLYNTATIGAPTILAGQYSSMAGVEIPYGLGIRMNGSTSNHSTDLIQTNSAGGLLWSFGSQKGNPQNGEVVLGSARVLSSKAPQGGVICPGAWTGTGTNQHWGCIGVQQDTGNSGPKWVGLTASGSAGSGAPIPNPTAVWSIDHTGKADFHGGLTVNGASVIDSTGRVEATALPTPLSGTTGSIGGSALIAGQCASGTMSIAKSTTSMVVLASPVTYPGDSVIWRGYVSSAGMVTVKVCAVVAATPAPSTYNVRVLQ